MSSFESKHSFEHLDKLAYEIGPRLAGSEGERRAAEYIKKYLKDCGLTIRIQKFQFVDKVMRTRVTALILAGVFVASTILGSIEALLTLILGVILTLLLPRIMPKKQSQNMIGSLKSEEPERRLVLSAHHDSAQCVRDRRWIIYFKFALPALLLAFLILLVLRLVGGGISFLISWSILGVLFLPTCAVPFFVYESLVSPGANDNASGVAIMLEVARLASTSTIKRTDFQFVAFGGEEQGLYGSKEFFSRDVEVSFLLNLDSIGAGTCLSIIEGNGILRRHRTSPELNEMLRERARDLGFEVDSIWVPFSTHDHLPFVGGGVDATTLTSYESGRKTKLDRFLEKVFGLSRVRTHRYSEIHTLEDVPEKIRLDNMKKVGNLVAGLFRLDDKNGCLHEQV
ncbi:hypothetical protein AKJ43_00715 [candidate division MSBL1 archaeon SCGC-AAA261D19]|uniref:Peptidase M28 domain-containing protein n=1 Tax=candidate division MSBL1 archaeon SCGC-AAA261D19 TaxID=1698273 RepID=A0A133V8H4_9EURY|nr:hypothetical protein AKJ43_00715 [candidate division MSBL1 archaeon SCGC-AAA261D19]